MGNVGNGGRKKGIPVAVRMVDRPTTSRNIQGVSCFIFYGEKLKKCY